jgi:hypothetical protein
LAGVAFTTAFFAKPFFAGGAGVLAAVFPDAAFLAGTFETTGDSDLAFEAFRAGASAPADV